MKKLLPLLFLLFISSCSDDNPTSPPTTGTIVISVKSALDSSNITPANVVLFNADNGASLTRTFTGSNGITTFESIAAGNYFVKISAQGFKESPQGNVSAVPFSVTGGQTTSRTYYLDTLSGVKGKIEGTVEPVVNEILITAVSSFGNYVHHTYTGPDGYFVLYNLEYDSYTVKALKAGYINSGEQQVTISSSSPSASVTLTLLEVVGAKLSGKVTFLAVNNGIVDVSILDRKSLSVVNGLSTIVDADRNYMLRNIPDGSYYAWASYKNDGYVMDPDWLFKNPGVLELSFNGDTAKVLDFSVTGAISLVSPTNPPEHVVPVIADSSVPLFSWTAYPQAKEYIIEVRDINGKIIWGGFNSSGTILHPQIPKELNSIRFNFDGSASAELIPGDIYQWKIYADDDAALNVQTLLSGSEDLMGLFFVP